MRTLASLFLICFCLPAVTVTKDGKSEYSICVSATASAADQHAASELQHFLEQMSSAKLPVDHDCQPQLHPYVFVGDTPAMRKIAADYPEHLGPESYVLKTVDRHVILSGGAPRGTLYAVYAFLDRLGCRWFTADASRIPKMRTINVPTMDLKEGPAFEYREPFFTEAADRDWSARNRTNGNHQNLDASTGGRIEYFPFVHSFDQLVPPQKYFKDHPEYFSFIDGARRSERTQLCLTNPDVLRVVVEQVRQWIREHPTAKIFSVSQNDWTGWCECDRCRRVEREEGDTHSGPMLRFVNSVAEEIEKTNPEVLIDTLAYWYTEDPPAKVRPRPNVRIRLCPIGVCEAHPYTSCPRSAYFARNLEAWHKITNQLYIWHYNTNFSHYVSPFPDFKQLANSISLYQKSGVVGLFMEGAFAEGGGAESAELRSYVMARLLWNPALDANREVDDFMQGVYGPAAKPMRKYYDLLQSNDQHIWIFNLPDFSEAFIKEARTYLNQAAKAAPDATIRRRVEKATLPLDYVELVKSGQYRVEGGVYGPADVAGFQARFHAFTARLRSFGIHSLREGSALDADEKTVDRMDAYEVVPLENERWQVSVVPALNGRVVRMIDRRTGQDVLRRVRAGEGYIPFSAGQVVEVFPDYPLHSLPVEWTTTLTRTGEVTLLGVCKNGLHIARKVRLDGDRIRTEVTAQNGSSEPLDVVLLTRAEFEPGDIDAARIRYHAASGTAVDHKILTPGEQPNGSETKKGTDIPDGEWTLERAGLSPVVYTFDRALAARSMMSYTVKGGARVTLGVWSDKRTLKPGESMTLESSYR